MSTTPDATVARGSVAESPDATVFRGGDAAAKESPQQPKRLGNFLIEAELGSGGMGTVYRAEQVHPVRRTVALKVIRPEAMGPGSVERFLAERQTLARMDHSDIATILDAGTDEGRPYFAMEYADGLPLDKYCDEHQLGVAQRVRLMIRVIRAIEHAHQRGVLHRDVKPDNVLVAGTPDRAVVKVIDFGIAKDVEAVGMTKTQAGEVLGTPYFMAPEQVNGQTDARSDVFSLGATLFRLLTGCYPISFPESAGVAEILERVAKNEVVGISQLYRKMSAGQKSQRSERLGTSTWVVGKLFRGDLNHILLQALAADRVRRYATAGDFADDLERYLNNKPVLAAKPTVAYRVRKFVHRNRTMVLAASAVGAVVVAASGVVGVREYQAHVRSETALTQLVSDVDNQLLLAEGMLDGQFDTRAVWYDSLRRAEATIGRGTDLLRSADAYDNRLQRLELRASALQTRIDQQRRSAELVDSLNASRDGGTGTEAYGVSVGARSNAVSLVAMKKRLAEAGIVMPSKRSAGTPVSEVVSRLHDIPEFHRDELIDSLDFMVGNGETGVGLEVTTSSQHQGTDASQFEGLQDRTGVPWVSMMPMGRPAAKSEVISSGHYLIAIASPSEKELVPTTTWSEDDVAQALTGEPGTDVRLQLETPFGEQYEVTLTRDGYEAYWAANVLALYDPHPQRSTQREAILSRDRAKLIALANREGVEDSRPFTLIQLAEALPESENKRQIELLRMARVKAPANFWANMAVAKALIGSQENGTFGDALRFLSAAAAIRPDSFSANTQLAMALMMTPMQTSAREYLQQSLVVNPSNTQNRYMLAQFLRYQSQYEDAVVEYKKLIEIEGPNAGTLSELAHAYGRLGDVDRQIEMLTEAVSLADGDPTIRYRLIGILREAGRDEEAVVHVEAVKYDSPPDYRGLAMAATGALSGGDDHTVDIDPRYMRERVEAGLTEFERHKFHGFVFANSGEMWAAVAAFNEALRINPNDEDVVKWRDENAAQAKVRGG